MILINKLNRIFKRIVYYSILFILKSFEPIVPRLYMPIFIQLLKFMGMKIKKPRYIHSNVKFDDFYLIKLGNRVVISSGVTLLTHDYSLTSGLIAISEEPKTDIAFLKPIEIKNNVFIGLNVTILPGTIINDNVVVGAGSVVRGVLEENSVYIGNPAIKISSLSDITEKWKEKIKSNIIRID